MRPLTQKEIDDAPSWAVSYEVLERTAVDYHERHYGFTLPLPNSMLQIKEFDIESYKHWCDPIDDNDGPNGYCYYDQIKREKAIEIAKYFKLTAEDLK